MFSVPLICSSSGVATVSAITLGLAPGNCAVTTTDGGTTSGYSEIGNRNIDSNPARKMATEITPAKIGRSMKNLERFTKCPYRLFLLRTGDGLFRRHLSGYFLGLDQGAGHDMLGTVHDHALTFGKA